MMQNDMTMRNEGGTANVCKCPHHKTIPMLVVLFGVLFLLGSLNVLTMQMVNISWPILVIVAGGMKMMGSKCKCC